MDAKSLLKKICVGSDWRHTLVRAGVLRALVYGLGSTVLVPFRVQGESMLPAYRTGDYGFINSLAYRWGMPQRFDIVGIRMAGTGVMYLKRIIGLPGERVESHSGIVHVNGEALQEPYLRFRGDWDLKTQSLAGDEYFVVGDNRNVSMHHHKFGKVNRQRIVGKAWPARIPLR